MDEHEHLLPELASIAKRPAIASADTIEKGYDRPQAGLSAPLLRHLMHISKSIRVMSDIYLAQYGFTTSQDDLLFALDEERPSHISHLAAKLQVRGTTISKTVERLAAKGLVLCIAPSAGARRKMIQLTSAGVDARDTLLLVRKRLEAELTDRLGADDLRTMHDTLAEVEDLLQSEFERLR